MTLRQLYQDGGTVDDDENMPPLLASPIISADDDDSDAYDPLDPTQDLETARSAVRNLSKSTESTRDALKQAREKLLAQKYDRTQALLAIATGLSRPTTSGGFAGFTESLGNMGAALQKPLTDKREFERQQMMDSLGIDEKMYGLDEKTAENAIKLAQIRARLTQLAKDPAAIQIYKYYKGLPAAEQISMLETMRNPNVQYKESQGVVTRFDPRAATHPEVPGITEQTPQTTLGKEAEAQRTLAEAKESGKTTGEKVATAQFNLPDVLNSSAYMTNVLTKLRDHPGMPWAVGAVQVPPIWGTKVADFGALLKQVQGQQFLEAYKTLKGTGQITEIEGQKATDAIGRMQTAQSEKAFVEAANDLLGVIHRATELARTHANQGTLGKDKPAAPSKPVMRFNKQGKRIS